MNLSDIGLIGLAVMGENLVLNMESKGFSVSVYNRTTEVTEKFASGRAKGKRITPTRTIEEFVSSLSRPRKMMIMVKAGSAVDARRRLGRRSAAAIPGHDAAGSPGHDGARSCTP